MPKTSRRITVHPLTLREVTVIRVADVTPGMRRITLAGEQLRAFTSANGFPQPAFESPGFDDDIRLAFCYPGQTEPVLPVQKEKGLDFPKRSAAPVEGLHGPPLGPGGRGVGRGLREARRGHGDNLGVPRSAG